MDIFLNIPEEVFHHDLFPKLDWNDLLRLRRVSLYSKFLADGYLKIHPELAPEIEINETNKTMDKFLDLDIPTSKVFLNNESGAEFYEKNAKTISTFLSRLGPFITHLRVDKYSYFVAGGEWDFLDELPNLIDLAVETCVGDPLDGQSMCHELVNKWHDEFDVRGGINPKIFKSLKRLTIKRNQSQQVMISLKPFLIIRFCEKLEYLALPMADSNSYEIITSRLHKLDFAFGRLHVDISRKAKKEDNPNISQLKIYDFNYHYDISRANPLLTPAQVQLEDDSASASFLRLCKTCVANDVKLEHVQGIWFKSIGVGNANPELGRCVASLVQLHPSLIHVDLANMEELKIATSRSEVVDNSQPHNWPSLKKLGIIVDSRKLNAFSLPQPPSSRTLFQCLFSNSTYPTLVHLVLQYNIGSCTPKAENIVSACPNLKILKLANWPGTNKSLTALWKGLPGLEEITLEGCKKLGNSAFVGEDTRDPVFFKLTGLKKLTLRNLDEMPKVTDTLFQLVLQHLKLTHLELSSMVPVKNVTVSGVRSLLKGKFATSIEKFSFKGWSLAGCSEYEFTTLGAEFRSHNMI